MNRYFCIGHAPENLYLLTPLSLDGHLPILPPTVPWSVAAPSTAALFS